MKNISELQITKTLKYEALYVIMGYDEVSDGVFEKNYAKAKINVNTNSQSVNFSGKIKLKNGEFILKNDKDFVILECVNHLLDLGYEDISIDKDGDFDICVKNIYIKCFILDATREIMAYKLPLLLDEIYPTIYESRAYSGLIERRYVVLKNGKKYNYGLLESKNIHLCTPKNIKTKDKNMSIKGKKLVAYNGTEKRLAVPDGIEEIQSACFWDNQHLEEIILPVSLQNLGGDTFYNCKSLKKLTLTKNIKIMGNNPFAGCSKLELKNESLHFIYENNLLMDSRKKRIIYYKISAKNENIKLPNSVQIIGKHAFYLAKNLKNLTLPSSIKKVENNPFSGCENLTLKSNSKKYIVENNIIYTANFKELIGAVGKIKTNPLVLREVETIARNSFWNQNKIKQIILPKSLKQIGYNPFVGCKNIEFISNSNAYKVKDGVLYNDDFSKLICCPAHIAKDEFCVQDSVNQLERGAFSGCENLSKIQLKNVFSIGKNCFTNCVALKEIYCSDFVIYIGEWAFAHCENLQKVSVFKDCFIDKKAFENTKVSLEKRQKHTNYLIQSENLYTLKAMTQGYKGKIDAILIDPPYNSNIDYIGYKDGYESYCDFIKERLNLSYLLLSNKGFLALQIDEGELENLNKICKDIFGESLVSVHKWQKIHPFFDTNRDVNPNKKVVPYEYIIICQKTSKARLHRIMQPFIKGEILCEKRAKLPKNFNCFGTTASAKDEMKEIFGRRDYFSTPKPLKLIKELVRATTNKDSIVMDFFAGSGTLGHAVMELNSEDGGNRTFILVSNNESNICQNVTNVRVSKIAKKYGVKYEFLCGF